MSMNTNITKAANQLNTAMLSAEQLDAVSGGIEQFPNVGNALYVKLFGRWVATGTEPFIPVDLDGTYTPE